MWGWVLGRSVEWVSGGTPRNIAACTYTFLSTCLIPTRPEITQGMSLVVLVFMPKVLAALAYGFLWAAGWNPLDNTDPKKPQVGCGGVEMDTVGLIGRAGWPPSVPPRLAAGYMYT